MNKALIAGTINHLLTVVFVLWGCLLTDFQCSGDDMSVVLGIYSFVVLPSQFFAEIFVFIAIAICIFKGKWKNTGKTQLFMFLASALLFVYVGNRTY